MLYRGSVTVLLLIFLALTPLSSQNKPLTNDDVIQMVKGGLDDETIIKAVQANDSAFDTSPQALVALKNAGVTKPVVDAMLDAEAKKNGRGLDIKSVSAKETSTPTPALDTRVHDPKAVDPAIYVEEVSSQGGVVASSDTALEAIKTLQDKHIRVVTVKDRADYILQVTRQLGKKSWKKDTKLVLSNKDGDVVLAKSTRTVGGGMGDVVDYIHEHHE
jgi:hypothetical protein